MPMLAVGLLDQQPNDPVGEEHQQESERFVRIHMDLEDLILG